MAEIDNWIKKQLKKGFKKEQIKDGLKKAGYQKNTIDSVDSFAKKNKKNKQLLIGSVIVLLVIILAWLVINNTSTKPDTDKAEEAGHFYSYQDFYQDDFTLTLGQFNKFVNSCEDILQNEKLKNKEQVLCIFRLNRKSDVYTSSFYVNFPNVLNAGNYISIAVNLNNFVRKELPDASEEYPFNICSISEPALYNPLYEEMNPEQTLIFPEGEIFCSKTFYLNEPNFASFTGFVPQSKSFHAEIYIVPQGVITKILAKGSFSEAKDMIKTYTLIWNLEKEVYTKPAQ